MFRRALSVAAAPSFTTTTTHPTTVPFSPLAPRSDVDLVEQRRMVAQENASCRARRNKQDKNGSLYGNLAPQEEARVMEFNRHSLRLLVLEAHQRQVVQTRDLAAAAATSAVAIACHEDPNSSMSAHSSNHSQASSNGMSNDSMDKPRASAVTPPPEGHFDLTATRNFNALLQDIDTLMAVAQQKPPQTRDRILNQTYEQLARLSLWNDLQ